MAGLTITNNKEQQRFEAAVNGELAYLEYRFHKNDIALMHTFVPDSLGGRGIATELAKYAFKYAEDNKHPVMVYCPFVASFLKKNPEYNKFVDAKYTHK